MKIRVVTTDKFDVINGDPKWDTKSTTINAKQAASEYVKTCISKWLVLLMIIK